MSSSFDDDVILTLDEAAEILRLPYSTVRDLVARGTIPAVKLGRQWRLRRSVVLGAVPGPRPTPSGPGRERG